MIQIGQRLFGAGAIALGFIGLVWGDFAAPWQPVPRDFPGYARLAYATAIALIAAGAALQVRHLARAAGLFLAAGFGVFALLWAIRIVRAPTVVAMWSGSAEDVVLVLGAVLAADATERSERWAKGVRIVLGICLLAFAAAHFVYRRETAAMVPPWIPPNATTWAYLTGAAHGIAGLALLADVFAAAAAWSLTAMFAGFEVLVWLPTLFTAPTDATSWRGSAINLCLTAAALLVAERLTSRSLTGRTTIVARQAQARAR